MQVNYVAGSSAPIGPSIFVVSDTGNPKAVNPATGTSSVIVGISQEFCAQAPIPGQSLSAAAAQGDPIQVYQIGDVCLLFSSTAGWTEGSLLTANSAGAGITATSGNYVGALALTSMSGAGLGQVQIVSPGIKD